MTEQELKSKISRMTLKEKALELTQYNYGDLMKGYEDLTVTGMNVDGDLTPEEYINVGTILNQPDGEALMNLRKKRLGSGITDPVIAMLDVIHGYRTNYPVPLAMACTFNTKLIQE